MNAASVIFEGWLPRLKNARLASEPRIFYLQELTMSPLSTCIFKPSLRIALRTPYNQRRLLNTSSRMTAIVPMTLSKMK